MYQSLCFVFNTIPTLCPRLFVFGYSECQLNSFQENLLRAKMQSVHVRATNNVQHRCKIKTKLSVTLSLLSINIVPPKNKYIYGCKPVGYLHSVLNLTWDHLP